VVGGAIFGNLSAFLVLPVIGTIGILFTLAIRETHDQPLVEEE